MAKVLLVDVGVSDSVPPRPFPNVGLAYLISSLKQAGHETLLLDLNNSPVSDEVVFSIVGTYSPHIIGISIKTATLLEARRVGALLKEMLPSVPVVAGGPHATVSCQELAAEPWIDSVVVGDGEEVFPLLCAAAGRGELLPSIVRASPIEQLDTLPFPDFSLFPSSVLDALVERYPLVTSRGCVYDCVYCSVPRVSGRRFRPRSSGSVLAELECVERVFGVRGFELIDDAFNLDVRRAKEFCQCLTRNQRRFFWTCPNGLRADLLDAELAMLMAKAGCLQVMVGVESAVPEVLAGLKKGESVEDIKRGVSHLQHAGIDVGGYFLIGAPGDTLELQLRNVEFIRRHHMSAHFNMLVPYPGTELWRWVSEHGKFLVAPERALHFSDSADNLMIPFETPEFPALDRMLAYEMVHTKIRRFDMLVPASIGLPQRYWKIIRLLWKYDRTAIIPHLVSSVLSLLRNLVQHMR